MPLSNRYAVRSQSARDSAQCVEFRAAAIPEDAIMKEVSAGDVGGVHRVWERRLEIRSIGQEAAFTQLAGCVSSC